MAKLSLIFVAVFALIALVSCADLREKRDTETTTANILDSIKSGIENTFSEQNIKKGIDTLNEFGEKLKDLGSNVVTNIQNAMKKDENKSP